MYVPAYILVAPLLSPACMYVCVSRTRERINQLFHTWVNSCVRGYKQQSVVLNGWI